MSTVVDTANASTPVAATRDFVALAKLRVASLVVLSSAVGFYLGVDGVLNSAAVTQLFTMMLGTTLVVASGNAINQVIERRHDALMDRTAQRPLAAGRMSPAPALLFAFALAITGLLILALANNVVAAGVALTALISYTLAYTPMKRVSPLAVLIGAVPGALPTVIGWSAATNDLGLGAWLLFAIVFFWQLPHFHAIAWIYRDDYARAGFKVLPVVQPTGKRFIYEVVGFSILLVPVTLLPTYFGMVGMIYYSIALLLGCAFLAYGLEMARLRTHNSARQHLWASLTYLTLVFVMLIVDKATG